MEARSSRSANKTSLLSLTSIDGIDRILSVFVSSITSNLKGITLQYTTSRKHLISLRYLYFALALCGIFIAALASSPVPIQAALKSPAPFYDGELERADCSQIAGFAYDLNAPDVTISVEIYAD